MTDPSQEAPRPSGRRSLIDTPITPARSRVRAVLRVLLVLVLITAVLAGILLYYYPQLSGYLPPAVASRIESFGFSLERTANRVENSVHRTLVEAQHTMASDTQGGYTIIDAQSCPLSQRELFERYHLLGVEYLQTRDLVNDSNQARAHLADTWRKAGFACPRTFVAKNRREIERLREVPVGEHFEEAEELNICAGALIERIETELDAETRPSLLKKATYNADQARTLESDLTNMARDLAFFEDKIERLIAEYRSNIEACSLESASADPS